MTKFTASKLSKILKEHKRWDCTVKKEGNRANLNGANLRKAELSDAYLRKADLNAANLSGAELSDANLNYAKLSSANLSGAYLYRADLSDANLSGANLNYAKLSSANLSSANLSGANLIQVKNLSINKLSKVKTLYKAKLDPKLMKQVEDKYPHFLEEPKSEE